MTAVVSWMHEIDLIDGKKNLKQRGSTMITWRRERI